MHEMVILSKMYDYSVYSNCPLWCDYSDTCTKRVFFFLFNVNFNFIFRWTHWVEVVWLIWMRETWVLAHRGWHVMWWLADGGSEDVVSQSGCRTRDRPSHSIQTQQSATNAFWTITGSDNVLRAKDIFNWLGWDVGEGGVFFHIMI